MRGMKREADPSVSWGRPLTQTKKQVYAICGTAGYGIKHLRKDFQNNVGKNPLAAGAGSNLPRLLARG